MQVHTQPVPIDIIELPSKKFLVRPEVVVKGKNIILGDPRTSNISQWEIARRASDINTNKFGGAGGRLNRVAEQSSLTRSSQTIRHLHVDGPVLMRTVRLTQSDSTPMARGVRLHTKRGRGCKDKAHVTHVVGFSKLTLLLINCSPNTLARRSFCDGPTKKPRAPAKTKWPERQHNKHHLFI
jgi:hypothetical protein